MGILLTGGLSEAYLKKTQHLLSNLMLSEDRAKITPQQSIIVCHSEPGAWNPALFQTSLCPLDGSLYTIGRTMFETDRIPEGWVARCNSETIDEIWVPTEFHFRSFRDSGVSAEKLIVIPEPIDSDFWSRSERKTENFLSLPNRKKDKRITKKILSESTPNEGENCFAFLSVFKWETRKAWDVLLRAFLLEFDATVDHVCLYIKTSHFHSTEEFTVTITKFIREELLLGIGSQQHKEEEEEEESEWEYKIPVIEVLSREIKQRNMPILYASVDCVVIPSRGEGWGRPHVEAMASGLPLIATNWSGPTAFMTEDNSYPLSIVGLKEIESGPWKNHMWAEPNVTHLRQLMRAVYQDPVTAKKKGAIAMQEIKQKFGLPAVSKIVVERLKIIKQKIKERENGKKKVSDISSENTNKCDHHPKEDVLQKAPADAEEVDKRTQLSDEL